MWTRSRREWPAPRHGLRGRGGPRLEAAVSRRAQRLLRGPERPPGDDIGFRVSHFYQAPAIYEPATQRSVGEVTVNCPHGYPGIHSHLLWGYEVHSCLSQTFGCKEAHRLPIPITLPERLTRKRGARELGNEKRFTGL
jgi:hypothetical protein